MRSAVCWNVQIISVSVSVVETMILCGPATAFPAAGPQRSNQHLLPTWLDCVVTSRWATLDPSWWPPATRCAWTLVSGPASRWAPRTGQPQRPALHCPAAGHRVALWLESMLPCCAEACMVLCPPHTQQHPSLHIQPASERERERCFI